MKCADDAPGEVRSSTRRSAAIQPLTFDHVDAYCSARGRLLDRRARILEALEALGRARPTEDGTWMSVGPRCSPTGDRQRGNAPPEGYGLV